MRTNLALGIPVAILLALLAPPITAAADAGHLTTAQRIERLGKELAEAWEKFPSEAQKSVRTQTMQDINQVFTREISKAEAPKDKTIAQFYRAYLDSLERTTDLFKVDKMKAERSNYIKGCGMTFKREWVFATDYPAERTTQKCYDMLLDMLETARDRFVMDKDKDLRVEAFQTVNNFFTDLTTKAKVPEGDHATFMDKNIKDAKAKFPTTTDAMKSKNGPAFSICETAARLIKQRALAKQN